MKVLMGIRVSHSELRVELRSCHMRIIPSAAASFFRPVDTRELFMCLCQQRSIVAVSDYHPPVMPRGTLEMARSTRAHRKRRIKEKGNWEIVETIAIPSVISGAAGAQDDVKAESSFGSRIDSSRRFDG